MSDESNSKPDIVELAKILDTGDIIGFTRSFVDDLKKGFEHVQFRKVPMD